ncbi:hypothetical protein VNI00_003872 [Paramarasmius palmivorus]|uniref:Uncharacterized protein n=1 Tax=Paramarasmius palmivorus TaxID=297713 RepID=A0AAW0DPY7_9AGAR
MTRESVSSDVHRGESLRRSRSHHPFASYLPEARTSRTSVISSAVLPYLRRLDITDDMLAQPKNPLLTLLLSSTSFLNTKVQDGVSGYPLYTIKTESTVTTISRSDTWGESSKAACIRWPKHVPHQGKSEKGKGTEDVEVQIRGGRSKSADDFLSPATTSSAPRRFKIPGYSHALKWKSAGSSFLCYAASAKGPIAMLEPAVDSAPARLKVFETLHGKHNDRPLAVHQGVSILLLDYLLVSALLLVTNGQERMMARRYEQEPSSAQGSSSSSSSALPRSPSTSSTSALQWRKIMFGEPMYRKRMSTASRQSSSQVPPTPTSAGQMAKIMFGKPIYPTLRRKSSSSDSSFSDDEGNSEDEDLSDSDSELKTEGEGPPEEVVGVPITKPPQQPSRPPSPSAESVFYPLTTTTAPSHTYMDPMFYNEYGVPPVPKIPAQYTSANSSRVPSPITSGSAHNSRRFRELPRPPSHRSQSTPRPRTADGSLSSPVESTVSSVSDHRRPSYDATFLVSPTSYTRTLPIPPPQSPIEPLRPMLPLRHSHSSGRPLNSRYRDKRTSQYSQRTLPPTPAQPKRCFGDLTDWLSSPDSDWSSSGPSTSRGRGRPDSILSVDCPPPAYNSAEFNRGTTISSTWPTSPFPPASSSETNI